jgi:HEXXH motif-containing protein
MKPDFESISWDRLAEPQEDQYDSLVVLEFARRRGYVRSEPGSHPTFFDGKIAIRNDGPYLGPDCVPASADHPNIAATRELVRSWPAVSAQLPLLIESVNVFLHTGSPSIDDGVGSNSSSGGSEFGIVSSTVNSAVGFAGSLVHEMAHHKLRALGVQFETAERLIRNPPEQKFRSPVRYDCLRPMAAVLQGQYSFTYSAAMCLAIVRPRGNPGRDRRIAEEALAVKLPKLVFGLEVLKRHARVDAEGAAFLEGLFSWSYRLFEEGFSLLKEMNVPIRKFAHPLKV